MDGTHASYADEFQWPSLQAAGGLVAEDPSLRSRNLLYRCVDLKVGETAEIGDCFFAVVGRVLRREPASYVTKIPAEGWQLSRASFDQSGPDMNNTQPINLASFWSEDPDAEYRYHLYIPTEGVYRLSACWGASNRNTDRAVYSLDGIDFSVDQRDGLWCWHTLGDVHLTGGMHTVTLRNRGEGNPHPDKLGGHMGAGKTINGIFSDHEGDYGYKMAWSEDLADEFRTKYGEDMRRILPLLIDRDAQGKDVVWRYRWFDTVSDIYSAHFHKLSRKAAERDLYFTMHTWEESPQLQACCVGDVFKLNRGISLPGTDALCHVVYNPQNYKDHFSVAEFEGVRFMNEVMALNGLSDYNPNELKKQGTFRQPTESATLSTTPSR